MSQQFHQNIDLLHPFVGRKVLNSTGEKKTEVKLAQLMVLSFHSSKKLHECFWSEDLGTLHISSVHVLAFRFYMDFDPGALKCSPTLSDLLSNLVFIGYRLSRTIGAMAKLYVLVN